MADTAVAVTTLTANTASSDIIVNAEGGTAVTTGNVAVIAASGESRGLIITMYAASASTVVFAAGDEPPSENSGLGGFTITIPAGDVIAMSPEAGRIMQDNGTIRGTVGANTVVFAAMKPPKGN